MGSKRSSEEANYEKAGIARNTLVPDYKKLSFPAQQFNLTRGIWEDLLDNVRLTLRLSVCQSSAESFRIAGSRSPKRQIPRLWESPVKIDPPGCPHFSATNGIRPLLAENGMGTQLLQMTKTERQAFHG
uniref:Uncharacterized protein n=1 Tax=Coccidioides posadasii RMSCC 3488 TaxID=454284 RepID=A0A0J6FLA4_COCPO|nr:hypothetical protein CPAG_06537 [Coccidioides posadasii RMSCC 3488]